MDYSTPCKYSIRLLEKLKTLDTRNVLDFELINKAIYWAKKYHGDQKRKTGEPFYSHPLEVAYMISEYKLKTEVIVASILHDIVEDTEVTVRMIQGTFGGRIAEMVDMLTRDRPDGSKLSVEQVLNNAYHLKDKEVLLIKLFDRLHNIQTIGSMNIDKMEKIINETLINFVLLSEYLELTSTAKKVQELCLEVCKCLNPEEKPYINIFSFNDNYQPLSLIYQND
ncbi:MAG: bifunctional (p)ppGpp synthetase/guanosine-3',5'-bis(diphosphate) 3'-pyrophosphohydrolase [Rickettsiaceae bacterium]|nr:bifunctional (p)ppGpp synthetase/guanosine-3',5'-bis(diphosphate) 3'-pyrophosphohydrolase [Rickettsiaceae bacterium]MCP5374610.1 bifunctional (p)ppGpp synthetase/guanosine-3',5'-bis(diphosphate) 3'-pyrophosphohydrolase [Rickettsiaceae bacterium]MCP5378652.1 bifunctional (p)ppGpp synthetase/guanosine-3',5'-bis(diphosphate) 3'-pyrophosphohydrolase [Rickettsiaceae bacterium]